MIEIILWLMGLGMAVSLCAFLFCVAAWIFWLPFRVIGFLIDLPKWGWKVSSARHF